jgi:AcrR family transcriptional regulator
MQKRSRHSTTRQRILAIAETLYQQGGYDQISLQVIADQLQMSKPALFYHFESKQTLFFELLLAIIEQHRARLNEVTLQEEPSAQYKLFLMMQQLTQKPRFDVVRFIHQEHTLLRADQQQEVRQAWQAGVFAPVQHVLDEGIQRGELRSHPTRLSAYMFLHLCLLAPHAALVSEAQPGEQEEPQALLLDLFLRGLDQY